jgi:DnaJ-related protein SCJ1
LKVERERTYLFPDQAVKLNADRNPHQLLGIEKNASEKEIKKAYRRLSKQYHPDKNPLVPLSSRIMWNSYLTRISRGDQSAADKFVAIAEAYDALTDPEQRRIYDQYGHEGLQQHKQGGGRPQQHDPFDLFSRFFGGGGHFQGERRGHNMEVKIAIPLRDFYNGRETEFSVEKQMICDKCGGSGSEDGQVDTCEVCGGRGMRVQRHMLAPGMFQQVQSPCDACGGKGKTIRHKCPVCDGARVIRQAETHQLNIERGMPRGVRITYENEADESPDWVAGDLIVHLVEQDPDIGGDELSQTDGTFFRRRGDDLFWTEVLSLREAWMGDWTRNVTHLDGHIVQLSRKRGQVVQPNTVEVIKGEGMPIWNQEHPSGMDPEFGALHVEYVVVLPDQLEKGEEKEFWSLWEKWRKKKAVNIWKDSGRPEPSASSHDEL